jgi:hypothetical protein
MQAKALMIVARTSGGAVKESPTLSIHNFSLETSSLPGSVMNPWTTGAWSGVVTRSVMIMTQPVVEMMNSKAMAENLDVLSNMVLGEDREIKPGGSIACRGVDRTLSWTKNGK